MLTETELMAKALAKPLSSTPNSFGANEAKQAIELATALFQASKVDAATFGRVMVRLGNHSQIRQWAVARGFIGTSDDALTNAVRAEITAMDKAIDEAVS
jgi:hypothetical protein